MLGGIQKGVLRQVESSQGTFHCVSSLNMIDWSEIRMQFPVTEKSTYLNTAAAGPLPRATSDAASDYYRLMMNDGDIHWDEWLAKREEVRKKVATFINAEADEVALTTNTSNGMNVIIDALDATGHKWMLSGYGSGFVYLSRELLARSKPHGIGWLSLQDPFTMRNDEAHLRHDAAARAELGCPHYAGIFALGASVDLLSSIGIENIEERALALNID